MLDGKEDYNKSIDDKEMEIDENKVILMRGEGKIGYKGEEEVVKMREKD